MDILLINHYAGSVYHGMEYRPYYIAKEWVKQGHKVTIVASTVSHIRGENPKCEQDFTEEWIDEIRYIWIKTPSYQGNGIKRVVNMLTFVAKLFTNSRRFVKEKYDAVIASSTYPLDIYPAYNIARKSGAKLIFEVHDLWPLTPMELGGMSSWHPFIFMMQRAENFAYRKADSVVSMLPKADQHMISHGMAPYKFNYIPNGINTDEWGLDNAYMLDEHIEVIKKHKAIGNFIVGYTGTIGLANAMTYLIDAANILRDYPISFILVGNGLEKNNLQRRVSQLSLPNVEFLPPVPKSFVPMVLKEFDALYIGANHSSLYRFGVSPNKLMDYMMARKPIIQSIEAGNDLVAESQCGVSVSAEDTEAIARGILELYHLSSKDRERMGEKGHKYVLKHHDYKILARKFLGVMQ